MVITLAHSTCKYLISARGSHDFPAAESSDFLIMKASICCRFYNREVFQTKTTVQMPTQVQSSSSLNIHVQLQWNRCDCDVSTHDVITFPIVMSQGSEI